MAADATSRLIGFGFWISTSVYSDNVETQLYDVIRQLNYLVLYVYALV